MDEHKLADIEEAIANRKHGGPLPEAIERDFALRTARFQKLLARSSMWPTIITYNAFLLVDLFLLPDTFALAVTLHVLVTALVVAICTRSLWLPDRLDSRWITAAIPTSMIAQIMTIYSLNPTENALHYQYMAIMVVVYSNVTQRLGIDYARFVSVGGALIYLVFLIDTDTPAHVLMVGYSMMCAAGYLTLIASKRMQIDDRFAFLQRLHEEARRREAERESMHDPLTKLGNRRSLDRVAARLWQEAAGATQAVGIILFDLDHFKLFNDNQGHARGDDCLRRIGEILAETVEGSQATAIRYGGEEFLVLVENTDRLTTYQIAERLRARVEEAGILHPESPSGIVTASFGVAVGHISTVTLQELVEAADEALYAAKGAGRNQTRPHFGREALAQSSKLAS